MGEMIHLEPQKIPGEAPESAPGAGLNFGKLLEIAVKIGNFLAAGFTGTFSTWTPLGKRWITISDKEPTG